MGHRWKNLGTHRMKHAEQLLKDPDGAEGGFNTQWLNFLVTGVNIKMDFSLCADKMEYGQGRKESSLDRQQ